MNDSQQHLALGLTYAGTLPLVIAATELSFGRLAFADAVWLACSYSAIILSFLAGIHWACYVFFAARCPRNLLITSNAAALLAWLSLLGGLSAWCIFLQILCFLYLLILDFKLSKAQLLPIWFFKLRCHATVIVVLSLALIMGQA